MSIKIGMHAGPQDLTYDELQRLWQTGDNNGFHWISVWDHFYANPLQDRNNPCFEGVAAMSALAATTTNVRVGCLVFCALSVILTGQRSYSRNAEPYRFEPNGSAWKMEKVE